MENIIFEHIETSSTEYKFGHGYYGHPDDPSSFKLIIMTGNTGEYAKYNGYVNGPKMISQALTKNGKPKEFKQWLRSNDSKTKVQELQNMVGGIPPTIEISLGGSKTNNLVSGTYIHPKLVLAAASWASDAFYFQASDILTEYSIQHRLEKKQCEIDILEIEARKKDDKIDMLFKKLERMELKAEEDRKKAAEDTQDIKISLGDQILDVQDHLEDKIDDVQSKLDVAVIHRVPPCEVEEKNEQFMLVVLEPEEEYKAIRGQKPQIEKMKRKYNTKRFIEFEEHPNAVNLLNRIRERQDELGIRIHNTTIYLNELSEKKFLEIVSKINDEKNEVVVPIVTEPPIRYTREGLLKLTLKQLRNICREKKIRGYSKYRKADLVHYILTQLEDNDEDDEKEE